MLPTQLLTNEHRAVERVLRVLNWAADRLEAGERVPPAAFDDSLDFLRNFADRCHHNKEEQLLCCDIRYPHPRQGQGAA